MTMTTQEKVLYILGVLIATASKGDTITYDELRRLARLSDRQLGTYLGTTRGLLKHGEPDLCAVVIKDVGTPGWGWGNLAQWQAALASVHAYWQDRRQLDNGPFAAKHGDVPSVPGTLSV